MKVNKSSIIDALKTSYLTSDSPQPTSKRKDFHTILAEHACFTQPQIWKEQKKSKRLAKSTKSRCRKVINVGTEYIVIEGTLMVPFNTNKAVAQKFCYCLDALCI